MTLIKFAFPIHFDSIEPSTVLSKLKDSVPLMFVFERHPVGWKCPCYVLIHFETSYTRCVISTTVLAHVLQTNPSGSGPKTATKILAMN